MNNIRRITKNIGVFGLAQVISSILAFIFLIYVARNLGEIQYGEYSFAIYFTAFFSVIADLGMSEYITREIAREKEMTQEYVNNVSLIKIILGFFTFCLIYLSCFLLSFNQEQSFIIYFFGIYTILYSFSLMFMSVFKAFEKLEYSSIIITIEKVFITTAGLVVLKMGYGINGLAYVYLFAGILDIFLSFLIYFKKIKMPNFQINIKKWKSLIKNSIPFSVNTLFTMLFFRADIILLSFLIGDLAVGIYSAAYNPLLALSLLLSNMTVSAIYPIMSRFHVTSKEMLEELTLVSSRYLIIIGVPITVGCFVLADKFINLFYAGAFMDSIIVFQILAFFIPLRLINGIIGTMITSINKQGVRSFIFVSCAFFNILLNLLLIPYLSYIGASIVTVGSELFLYALFMHYINKNHTLNINKFFIKPVIASMIMGLFLAYFKVFNLIILIIIGTLIYFGCLIILKTFNERDKEFLTQLIKNG